MEDRTRLTYRIVHHLQGDLGKGLIRFVLELGTHGLYVEEIMARVLIGGQYAFGPLQCLVSPGSDRTLRVKRVNGGQVLGPS